MKTGPILIAFLLSIALWGCGSKAEKSPRSDVAAESTAGTPERAESTAAPIPVKLTAVTSVVRAEPVVASGLVSSAEEARLSFKVGGIINKMFVDEGQPVRKGQLLATLDLTEIDAQVVRRN